MANPRLTPHQRDTLRQLARRATIAGRQPGRWVNAKDCGGPAALEHLREKGYAERQVETGPRGGEHLFYRPTATGYVASGCPSPELDPTPEPELAPIESPPAGQAELSKQVGSINGKSGRAIVAIDEPRSMPGRPA